MRRSSRPVRQTIVACSLAVAGVLAVAPSPAHAASVGLACLQRGGSGLVAHPTRCAVVNPGRGVSSGADLWGLRWKKWGFKTATARGVDQLFRNDGMSYRVTVTATGRSDGRYTRVVVNYGGGVTRSFAPR
jgi:hypothetical protein